MSADRLSGQWDGLQTVSSRSFKCGHCGNQVASQAGLICRGGTTTYGAIFVCHCCNKPTFLGAGWQVPGPRIGADIEGLPKRVKEVYNEARACMTVDAWTAAALCCRKLLQNIANSLGAVKPGLKFVQYIDWLDEQHYIPPGNKAWVERIREIGGEATHQIPKIDRERVVDLLRFVEMLLSMIYKYRDAEKEPDEAQTR